MDEAEAAPRAFTASVSLARLLGVRYWRVRVELRTPQVPIALSLTLTLSLSPDLTLSPNPNANQVRRFEVSSSLCLGISGPADTISGPARSYTNAAAAQLLGLRVQKPNLTLTLNLT